MENGHSPGSNRGTGLELHPIRVNPIKKKTITATPDSARKEVTKIKRIENKEGVLFLQGAEDGYENVEDGVGWTLVIEEDSGKGVLTGATPGAAFVAFGVCTPH